METGRLVGIDLARLVAVAGMMAAHTVLNAEPERPAAVVALVDGPPSTLFAVLGGVSVVLAARTRLAAGDRGGALRSTAVRGLLVAALGVLIAPLATAVFVVLVPFGVSIVLAGLLLVARSWAIAVVAAALWAGGGTLAALGRHELLPALERGGAPMALVDPALGVLLTGVYPVVTWLVYLLVGMLVARALLAARRGGRERVVLAGLAALGAVLVAAALPLSELGVRVLAASTYAALGDAARDVILANGYGAVPGLEPAWQLVAAPHSGTPTDIARTVGIALLVIGLLGLAVSLLPRAAVRVLEPLRAAGGAPLTIYVVHVVLVSTMAAALAGVAPGLVHGWGAWALQLAVALAIGALLAATGARGPLERLIGRIAGAAAGRATAPS
ncbi:heparan-alpha-glucosaminide N-acetyltransferase domain-containing protein [Agrococcus beijingensis]|uniref:heparan-alpha-glucosaminide N-acetyltransferase domain-containing protein n=1 Tax=Agrococcus beijingensis TaxID=3068634 RepID=UPI0027420688|nr:heparan-alpha-glucosaminide N-acetyltransferase domain-containing protein [Agrococcus sp. REN33]